MAVEGAPGKEAVLAAFADEVAVGLKLLEVEANACSVCGVHGALPGSVDMLLRELPTAHPAPPIGGRSTVSLHHLAIPPASSATAGPRIRFVYFSSHVADSRRDVYHRHLLVAELLLNRVLAARASGLHPLAPGLTRATESRALHRPPRQLLGSGTLEYRRWYDSRDEPRERPLTIEQLGAWLVKTEGVSPEIARQTVLRRTRALPESDQLRLLARRQAPVECRPLNQAEFRLLVESLDAACRAPSGSITLERANREIARRAVALLAQLLEEFTASPFVTPELDKTFSACHVESLRRGMEASRQGESLLVGPRAWFAAKSVRMQAEHQMALALNPLVTDARTRFRAAAMRVRLAVNRQARRAATG